MRDIVRYPSTEQFRHAIAEVRRKAVFVKLDKNGAAVVDKTRPIPTLKFRGTTKVHGTNAALSIKDGELLFQSRERVLSLEADNAGFMRAMVDNMDKVTLLLSNVRNRANIERQQCLTIYGEWCGRGVQSGVAVSELEKRLMIFAIKVDDNWLDIADFELTIPDSPFYSILDAGSWEVDINFANPALIQNHLIDLTNAVEAECPVSVKVSSGSAWTLSIAASSSR